MPSSQDQPGILVICSDEHHPHIAGYRGNRWVKTPYLGWRLHRRGRRHHQNYNHDRLITDWPVEVASR